MPTSPVLQHLIILDHSNSGLLDSVGFFLEIKEKSEVWTSLPVVHWIGINQSLPFRAPSFAPITANCKCQRVAKAKGPGRGRRGRGRREGHFGAAWWPGQPRCSEAGTGQRRRAERVGSGAVPRGAGTGSGAPGTSAERRPGAALAPGSSPLTSALPGRPFWAGGREGVTFS